MVCAGTPSWTVTCIMVDVVLHGYFKAFHDGPLRINASTVAEAIEAVTRQLPGFRPRPRLGRHRLTVVGCRTEADLYKPLGDQTEIHVVPQMNGGKSGGMWQILLGAALIGVGLFIGASAVLGSIMIKVGAMMVLGGLAQMLAPTPEAEDEQQQSRYLGAPLNTVKIGTRIPILYGKYRVGGQYLSFNINAKDIKEEAT